MKKERVLYYSDLANDDFSKVDFDSKPLPDDFEYIPKNPFRRLVDWLLYYGLASWVARLYTFFAFRQKIVNKGVIKPYKKTGYFIYGNHTRMGGDAFTPGIVTWPDKPYIITNNDSASNPLITFFTKSLGSLPLPSSLKGFKNFSLALKERINEGNPVCIYPEAHIWPFYTKIRPFKEASFHYPVDSNRPVFTFTTTYQKRRLSKKPKTVVYVDGPFFPKEDLRTKENMKYLRDICYDTMVMRSKNSSYEYVKYIYKENIEKNND